MRRTTTTMVLCAASFSAGLLFAQDKVNPRKAPDANVLSEKQWEKLDSSVDRGLAWLATQQKDDGRFESIDLGQPAVTSFCVMAFLAQGESLVDGKYEQSLSKAIDFIVDQQKPNGLIARNAPAASPITRDPEETKKGHTAASKTQSDTNEITTTAVYNHAISALALCEVYGECSPEQAKKLAPAIEKAIAATLEMQNWKGKPERDVGGWRYLTRRFNVDSDLSVTGWQLMFLRSAKGAGFDVPHESIKKAVKYIDNCFLEEQDRRVYSYLTKARSTVTRGMAGGGILAMAHAGKHDSEKTTASADWILKNDFSIYDSEEPPFGAKWVGNRYHYGAFLCTLGMHHMGGKYWEQYFPELVVALLGNQKEDGSWETEKMDKAYGACYTTSLSILSLSAPNQLLPILQR